VARNVRFARDEIEGITPDFVTALDCQGPRPPFPRSPRGRGASASALGLVAMEIWPPDGVSDENIYQEVRAHLGKRKAAAEAKAVPGKDTVLCAAWRRKDKPNECDPENRSE
jgi:hypothetical protein